MSEAAEVLTQVEDGILIVTINRPEAKNAMNKAAAEGICAAMDRLEAVTHVGKRPTDDDAHRITQVRRAHLVFDGDLS